VVTHPSARAPSRGYHPHDLRSLDRKHLHTPPLSPYRAPFRHPGRMRSEDSGSNNTEDGGSNNTEDGFASVAAATEVTFRSTDAAFEGSMQRPAMGRNGRYGAPPRGRSKVALSPKGARKGMSLKAVLQRAHGRGGGAMVPPV
jgi:hypothetical protein